MKAFKKQLRHIACLIFQVTVWNAAKERVLQNFSIVDLVSEKENASHQRIM